MIIQHTNLYFRIYKWSSGKNTLFSVWPGSFAIACNFGEGSDFLSDRKQEPKLTLAACKPLAKKLNGREGLQFPERRPSFIRKSGPKSSKNTNLSPDPYLLRGVYLTNNQRHSVPKK